MSKTTKYSMNIIIALSVALIIIDFKNLFAGQNIHLLYRLIISNITVVSLSLTIKKIVR